MSRLLLRKVQSRKQQVFSHEASQVLQDFDADSLGFDAENKLADMSKEKYRNQINLNMTADQERKEVGLLLGQLNMQKDGWSREDDCQQPLADELLFLLDYNRQDTPISEGESRSDVNPEQPRAVPQNGMMPELLPVDKNNNVIKLLNKKIIESLTKTTIRSFFSSEENTNLVSLVDRFVKCEKAAYKKNKNHNNNLESLERIFGMDPRTKAEETQLSQQKSKRIRKLAHSWINEKVIPHVMGQKKIKELRKSYILKLKVMRLRLRSSKLITRTEF